MHCGCPAAAEQEVAFAAERGVPVIDVRPADAYEKGHVPGASNVPVYQPIQVCACLHVCALDSTDKPAASDTFASLFIEICKVTDHIWRHATFESAVVQ